MTKTPPPSRGFTYAQHARIAIELGIAERKIFAMAAAIYSSYPAAVWRSVLNKHAYFTKHFRELRSLLDDQLFLEQAKNNLSLKARCIYYNGLGNQVIKMQGIDFHITPTVSPFFSRKKPGFTVEQYRHVQQQLEEVKDLFWFLQVALSTSYIHKPDVGKLLLLIHDSLEQIQTTLENRLKKKHGETHVLFTTPPIERTFLDNSLTDLTTSARHIAKYIKALHDDDNKAICRLEELAAKCTPPKYVTETAGTSKEVLS